MRDEDKTKAQLIKELGEMRQQLTELAEAEMACRLAEAALRESEERFRRIFQYSNDAILLIDPAQDEILDANPTACRMLGYSHQELLSLGISDIHPDEMPRFQIFAQSVFEQGGGWTNELTCLTKTGNSLPAEISASLVDVDGRPCLIALVRDITERKQAEEALRASEARLAVLEERQRLARDLHDSVTQGLYGLNLYAEATARLLSTGNVEMAATQLREMRDTAQEALREMRLLIYELRPPVLEEEGLVAALQNRLEAVEERAGLETTFKVEGDGRLPPAIEEGLYRIAQEALNNALRHAHAHRISMYLRQVEPTVILEITDDGVGFDPSTTQERGGLGLRGMEERVEGLSGSLSIDSAPGAGTRVKVTIPVNSE
jgi:PAS domain S-box-containing protein